MIEILAKNVNLNEKIYNVKNQMFYADLVKFFERVLMLIYLHLLSVIFKIISYKQSLFSHFRCNYCINTSSSPTNISSYIWMQKHKAR